ncbi:MAG: hypothetical protein FWD23_00900 [Oscillospiraceae bacterium]|nr:hypothetical protein [Oscillospiraceae bacterium]
MEKLTSHERIKRMFNHQEADRIPIMDGPWGSTIARWQSEGMPAGMSFSDYFEMDVMVSVLPDSSPRYPHTVIEDAADFCIVRDRWGCTMKYLKNNADAAMPQFLDFTAKTKADWLRMKEDMAFSRDRMPLDRLAQNYADWRKAGLWVQYQVEVGFNVVTAYWTGIDTFLLALMEEPEWCHDMIMHGADLNLQMLDAMWDAGYELDCLFWCDDMGYKGSAFFSLDMYRSFLKPAHQKLIDWAHSKNIPAHLHSCGNVMKLVPELVDMGLDGLNPLEIKAGMDPVKLKGEFGDKLLLHGGIDAMRWKDIDYIEAEARRLIPVLMENGGYIFGSDHSVPHDVSLENFGRIVNLAKKLGCYQ